MVEKFDARKLKNCMAGIFYWTDPQIINPLIITRYTVLQAIYISYSKVTVGKATH